MKGKIITMEDLYKILEISENKEPELELKSVSEIMRMYGKEKTIKIQKKNLQKGRHISKIKPSFSQLRATRRSNIKKYNKLKKVIDHLCISLIEKLYEKVKFKRVIDFLENDTGDFVIVTPDYSIGKVYADPTVLRNKNVLYEGGEKPSYNRFLNSRDTIEHSIEQKDCVLPLNDTIYVLQLKSNIVIVYTPTSNRVLVHLQKKEVDIRFLLFNGIEKSGKVQHRLENYAEYVNVYDNFPKDVSMDTLLEKNIRTLENLLQNITYYYEEMLN